ncbi:DnaJ-like cysteine-rich domain-containing protein [Moraxella cuniculi]|uniref:Uncharacterized protein n=1 Tax=Moraxella cuniculi TaxID=34061 RepID=A0A3S4R5Q3_9GAMM|nr:hypothetical protein [Moraxella cuniculi]VEG13424.1 Uncharacterised protein [Moraxella cuniculi]
MYQADGYHPQADIDILLKDLQALIDGNQAVADDLSVSDWSASTFSLTLSVNWLFSGYSDKQTKAGNHKQDICFANTQELDKHYHNLMNEASFGQSLRQNFLQNIRSLNKQALLEYQQSYTFHQFEPFSIFEDCGTCHAVGKVSCTDCGGRGNKSCWDCGGGGQESYQVPIYDNKNQIRGYQTQYRSCSACFGSGRQRCGTCSGSGRVACNNCAGHGFFTHIYQIKAQAQPTFHLSHTNPFEPDEFNQLFVDKGAEFFAKHIDLALTDECAIEQDTHQFVYQGQSIAFDILLMMKQKQFYCAAFSSPPYAYVRPYLFDELFFDEWQFLKNAQDKKGNIAKNNAQAFFFKYMNQPVLDSALKDIAKNNHAPKTAVKIACQNYISDEMANNIGRSLWYILDKVSPTHSKLAWVFGAVPACLWLGVVAVYHLQTVSGVLDAVAKITKTIWQSMLVILICVSISWLLSRLFVWAVNQKIPKEYHQAANNRLMLRYYLMTMGVVVVLAIIYAVLVNYGYLPPMSDRWYLLLMAIKGKLPF